MDEDRSGEPRATDDQEQNGVLPPRPLKPESKQSGILPKIENRNSEQPKRAFKERWREFWAADTDRHVELILAGAITLFALCQLVITCSNNSSTSTQVNKLITAANSIQESANSFSGSASDISNSASSFSRSASEISNGIDDAVGKLGDQAQKMDAARKQSEAAARQASADSKDALDKTISNQRMGERAYLVVPYDRPVTRTCPGPGMPSFAGPIDQTRPFCLVLSYTNVGKTPAANIQVRAWMDWDNPIMADDKLLQNGIPQQNVLGSGDKGSASVKIVPNTVSQRAMGFEGYYVRGKISYLDAFGVPRWSTFCHFYPQELGPEPCDGGDSFDHN
jgi:hypothetical protein